jgi:CheY-like chemotaxis protein
MGLMWVAAAADRLRQDGRRVKILLVDDSRTIRTANQKALAEAGYEVICAEDGESAIEMAEKTRPDLILLDLILPKMSGPEVLEQLKRDAKTAKIPVVVLSSLSDKNRQKLIEAGAEEYLEKNVIMPWAGMNLLPDKLQNVIRKINNRKAAAKSGK